MKNFFDDSIPTDEHGCFIISKRKSDVTDNSISVSNPLGIGSKNVNRLFDEQSKKKPKNKEESIGKYGNYDKSSNLKYHNNPEINNKIREYYKTLKLSKYPLNDAGNAKLFLDGYEDYIKYNVDLEKWYIWEGRYWKVDLDGEIYKRALHVMQTYRKYAEKNDADETIIKHTIRSGNHSAIKNLLKVAENLCSCHSSDFNQHKHLLNVKNGTIDLRTKKIFRHKKSNMITHFIEVDYSQDSFGGLFKQFIYDLCCNDKDLVNFLSRAYGYCVTGETSEQCLFIELGYGSNGKSTLNEACKKLLANYTQTVNYGLFKSASISSSNSATPEIAKLVGTRMVICSETSDQLLNEAKVKELTGGTELTARSLYKDPFKFVPQFKLIFETNILPRISGFDHGFWRRVVVIPFLNTFEKDSAFQEKIFNEQEALLAWLVEGAYKFYKDGLGDCKAVKKASRQYRYAEDTTENFISSKVVKTKGNEYKSKLLFDEYVKFCNTNEIDTIDNKKFKEAMIAKGFRNKRKSSGIVWLDIDVKR